MTNLWNAQQCRRIVVYVKVDYLISYKFISIPTVNKRCEKATGDFPFYVVSWEKSIPFNIFEDIDV